MVRNIKLLFLHVCCADMQVIRDFVLEHVCAIQLSCVTHIKTLCN